MSTLQVAGAVLLVAVATVTLVALARDPHNFIRHMTGTENEKEN